MRNSISSRAIVRFGDFELNQHAGELRRQGTRVRLQEQPLQILQILLEQPGKVVSREEIRKRIWPSDTFVDFDHGINNAIKRLREALGDTVDEPRFIQTLAKQGYKFLGNITDFSRQIQSLLVLPLENLSRDPEQEYFADGLTEELITRLAKIGALRVLSRTTAMHYKGVRKPLPEIARELQVEGVVEGAVLRSGDRVRISAQLIHAPTDSHLWAESYERDLRDVLQLQAEVAAAIAEEIEVNLTLHEQTQLRRSRKVVPDAYDEYLRGRYFWNKRTAEALSKAAEYFQRAIELDPTYAIAYSGLADCAERAGYLGFLTVEQGSMKAKAIALKALEIDDTLAESHASLGSPLHHLDWNFMASEKEFRRAIALNPGYASAHEWYGHCLFCIGRFEEGLAETGRALQLDPLSSVIKTSHAAGFWMSRQWDRAIEQCLKGLEFDPDYLWLLWILGNAYQGKEAYEEAIRARKRVLEVSPDAAIFVAELGSTYAAAGKRGKALDVLEQVYDLSRSRYVMAYWVALIHANLNQKCEAFRWLDKAYSERSGMLAYVKSDPRFDNLRSDPRFDELLRRMNFPHCA